MLIFSAKNSNIFLKINIILLCQFLARKFKYLEIFKHLKFSRQKFDFHTLFIELKICINARTLARSVTCMEYSVLSEPILHFAFWCDIKELCVDLADAWNSLTLVSSNISFRLLSLIPPPGIKITSEYLLWRLFNNGMPRNTMFENQPKNVSF